VLNFKNLVQISTISNELGKLYLNKLKALRNVLRAFYYGGNKNGYERSIEELK